MPDRCYMEAGNGDDGGLEAFWRAHLRAQEEVIIVSPYLTSSLVVDLATRCASVSVLTRCDPMDFVMGSSSLSVLRKLVTREVPVYAIQNLHAKIVVTKQWATIGSKNLTLGSARNIEATVLVERAISVERIRAFLTELKQQGTSLTIQDIDYTERRITEYKREWKKLKDSIASRLKDYAFGHQKVEPSNQGDVVQTSVEPITSQYPTATDVESKYGHWGAMYDHESDEGLYDLLEAHHDSNRPGVLRRYGSVSTADLFECDEPPDVLPGGELHDAENRRILAAEERMNASDQTSYPRSVTIGPFSDGTELALHQRDHQSLLEWSFPDGSRRYLTWGTRYLIYCGGRIAWIKLNKTLSTKFGTRITAQFGESSELTLVIEAPQPTDEVNVRATLRGGSGQQHFAGWFDDQGYKPSSTTEESEFDQWLCEQLGTSDLNKWFEEYLVRPFTYTRKTFGDEIQDVFDAKKGKARLRVHRRNDQHFLILDQPKADTDD